MDTNDLIERVTKAERIAAAEGWGEDALYGEIRDALASLQSELSALRQQAEAMAWFSGQHQLELSYYSPFYGDDDDQATEWRVHRQGGSINDREWDLVSSGQTALEAILTAWEQSNG